jgi:hypothetical protein
MDNLKLGGRKDSATASSASVNPKPGTSNAPRMLTQSEIASLRQHKAMVTEVVRRQLETMTPNP